MDLDEVERTLAASREQLLSMRIPAGHWEGELSASALSTATAVCALEIVRRNRGEGQEDLAGLIRRGLRWLRHHQNEDGGFGDTVECPSNISTTALAWATLSLCGIEETRSSAEAWLKQEAGELTAPSLARAIGRRYGTDRTFSVPILTMCALAGRFGQRRDAWSSIPRLPFELAALPRSWFRWLGLPVVSYALPALIAIGQVGHHHRPTRNPVARLMRFLARKRTLRILESIQPASGGFLEAAPLTSFVAMSLAAAGGTDHAVTRRSVKFLVSAARQDGSWPIDTNLATWVTTLSIRALSAGGHLTEALSREEQGSIRAWLLGQQLWVRHPYTHAAPGGWAWTDRSGGVPDADDTPGALLALSSLGDGDDPEILRAVHAGTQWLLDLQNRDGGIPTFCRGWGKLPFDQSSPDLTAHVVRAWSAWKGSLPGAVERRVKRAMGRAIDYLLRAQRKDGAWIPLWFGNPWTEDETNPVYGTTRVLMCAGLSPDRGWRQAMDRAAAWLLSAQNPDGGFGGGPGVASSIEETALAVEALAGFPGAGEEAVARGCRWLAHRTAEGSRFESTPMGLYFARLWYREELYPLVFTVSALERVLENLRRGT